MRIKKLNINLNQPAVRNGGPIVFNFPGGLADQVRYLAYAIEFYKSGRALGQKIYFNAPSSEKKWGGYKLDKFNVSAVIDFEIVDSENAADIIITKMSEHMVDSMPYANDIKTAMKLTVPLDEKNLEIIKKIRDAESVCVHIRRSDFVGRVKRGGSLGAVSAKYLNNAISDILIRIPKVQFFIFSQDFEWVKQNVNFGGAPFEFVNINDNQHAEFELELIKNCKHFILSCGGFGRLAAFLSENANKIITMPNFYRIRDWEIFEYNPFKLENLRIGFLKNMRMLRKKIYAYFLLMIWKIGIIKPV